MQEKTLPAVRQSRLPQINRARELKWLHEHRHEYAGQWVVLDGDQLLGFGSDPRPLLAQARAAGNTRPLIIHIPPEAAPFTGGWL